MKIANKIAGTIILILLCGFFVGVLAVTFNILLYRAAGVDDSISKWDCQFKQDTVDVLTNITCKKLVFKTSTAIYIEVTSVTDGSPFITYDMMTIRDGRFFDFSLKIREIKKKEYYDFFQNVLFNFTVNGKSLFNETDELKDVVEVKL